MTAAQFKIAIEKVSFGKRLPIALFVVRPADGDLIGPGLWATFPSRLLLFDELNG